MSEFRVFVRKPTEHLAICSESTNIGSYGEKARCSPADACGFSHLFRCYKNPWRWECLQAFFAWKPGFLTNVFWCFFMLLIIYRNWLVRIPSFRMKVTGVVQRVFWGNGAKGKDVMFPFLFPPDIFPIVVGSCCNFGGSVPTSQKHCNSLSKGTSVLQVHCCSRELISLVRNTQSKVCETGASTVAEVLLNAPSMLISWLRVRVEKEFFCLIRTRKCTAVQNLCPVTGFRSFQWQ